LGEDTPLYKKKRKEKIKERGNKEKFLNFSSRELTDADKEKSRRNLKRLLEMENQQKFAV